MRRWVCVTAITAMLLALSSIVPAYAHWADRSVAEIVVGASSVRVTLTLPATLLSGTGTDGDSAALAVYVEQHLVLAGDAGPGIARVDALRPPEDARLAATHRTLELTYSWPRPLHALTIRYDLFPAGVPTASCLATIVRDGRVQTFVFTPQTRTLTLGAGWPAFLARLGSFIVLGIEHILTGYDHILFLLSLLMLGGGLRYLIRMVSAFTVAHSLTLSLAVLNVVTLPPRWVESAIALSIVYVATENFWRKEQALRNRWLITFGFGLVHGLGLASILKEIAIPRANLALSLASFNVGVEIGQVAIVAIAFVLIWLLRAWPWEVVVRRLVSAAAATAGVFWFIQRAILPL